MSHFRAQTINFAPPEKYLLLLILRKICMQGSVYILPDCAMF